VKFQAVGAGVSEEKEGASNGPEGNGAGIDPVAVALALGGASQAKADAFLDDQRSLIADQKNLVRLQAEELRHELKIRHWSLWVRHASGVLKLTLEVGLAMVAVALACFLGAALWNAAHADGLVIESFSVPPDLAQRGLTGQVIAGQLLDRLNELEQGTVTARSGKSYAASWGDDIKVEIPDTGVSVAEAYRFLRRWLGHESHISGAVWRGPNGIVITARSEGQAITVTGADADLDGPIRKAAEAIFGLAEPYRYAVYLVSHGRATEAITVARQMLANGNPADRPWGLLFLARQWGNSGDISGREQLRMMREAVQLDPGDLTVLNNLAAAERNMSHPEAALGDFRRQAELIRKGGAHEVGAGRLPVLQEMTSNAIRHDTGDHSAAIPSLANVIRSGNSLAFGGLSSALASEEIGDHDLKAARTITLDRQSERMSDDAIDLARIRIRVELAIAEQDWPAVVAAAVSAGPLLKRRPGFRDVVSTSIVPLQAYAEARQGHLDVAEKLIASTPPDCDACTVQRARIAELRGQHARADWWFARAVADAPSIPLVYATWGQALLERGKPDDAITRFKLANQKGPHFADPLEGWGEALMAKNQSHLALAKFAEAEKYAPNWGRLHLKWGEALVYAGKKDEAKTQIARAAQLDLTPSEKAELARMTSHV
jgi:hypothetical protein